MWRQAIWSGVLLFLVEGGVSFAASRTFQVVPDVEGKSGVRFSIGYTFGTHDGIVQEAKGTLSLGDTDEITGGKFQIPLKALKTGSNEKDCHLYESMGLDYTKSAFPGDHVCKDDELPKEGKDSIAFPEISFEILRAQKKEASYEIVGRWNIHGVSRESSPLLVTLVKGDKPGEAIRLQSHFKLPIADFGIVVKKFFVISVSDDAKVDLDLLLKAI